MQTNIIWKGIEYDSLENCFVKTSDAGTEISSFIVGKYGELLYRVEYLIKTNSKWQIVFFEINSQHNEHFQHLLFESNGNGRWFSDGKEVEQYAGCMDIDIPLTPFTNTLPINRLNLAIGEEREITVMYLDLFEKSFTPVKQKYRRVSDTGYHYENVPNDFEATIMVDESGLVVNYPALFIKTAEFRQD